MKLPKISIIIPVLNEAQTIISVLHSLQDVENVEIIVVDGGSDDGTPELVESHGFEVLTSAPGRAHQMNRGAGTATGEILLFLHADTTLPPHFETWVRQTLEGPGIVAGAFRLAIEGQQQGLRWVETWVNWRSRWCQMPYGDQGIFLKTSLFRELGGFPALPIMEDFEMMRRLQPLGKIAIVPQPVVTSGRRWQKLGIWKTTLINQIVVLAYLWGVSPHRIVRWYRGHPKMTSVRRI